MYTVLMLVHMLVLAYTLLLVLLCQRSLTFS